jgi:hypothetical protein
MAAARTHMYNGAPTAYLAPCNARHSFDLLFGCSARRRHESISFKSTTLRPCTAFAASARICKSNRKVRLPQCIVSFIER